MLNQENIQKLIANPNLIGESETAELKLLLDEYPYTHSLNLLYLKGLKNTRSIVYDKQLSKTSIQVPNREILYQRIIQEELVETIKEIENSTEDISSETTKKESQEKPVETSVEETKSSLIINELEETILSEVTSYSIDDISTEESNQEKPEDKPKTSQKQSFTSWLNINKTERKQSLIDSFIEKNPSIKANQSELYSAPNVAKMSLVEDEGFVTETLARVYMKQGHFDKAIKTYQKLSLKNPEKKAFFASQIEVIEELKKQE